MQPCESSTVDDHARASSDLATVCVGDIGGGLRFIATGRETHVSGLGRRVNPLGLRWPRQFHVLRVSATVTRMHTSNTGLGVDPDRNIAVQPGERGQQRLEWFSYALNSVTRVGSICCAEASRDPLRRRGGRSGATGCRPGSRSRVRAGRSHLLAPRRPGRRE